jgi:hypothetical protein
VGWRVAHVAAEEDAALVCGKIDGELARLTAEEPDYDLISGLVGFGVYALARGEAGRPIASAVMDRLAAMARPRRGGLAIHTAPERLPAWQRAEAPQGYWNFGVAHGMPGVAALLARFVAAGVEVERAGALLEGIMQCLLTIEPAATGEKYPPWLTGRAEAELGAIPDGERSGRLAWCYGDLGASLALFSAAQATGNAMWRDEAIALARGCAARGEAKAQLRDTAICHGALGAAHQFNRLWQATGDEGFATAARHWLDRGLAMRRDHPVAGFPSCLFEDGVENWVADGTLLSGAAGVALILHAMITRTEPLWDRLLLIDLEPMAEDRGPRTDDR